MKKGIFIILSLFLISCGDVKKPEGGSSGESGSIDIVTIKKLLKQKAFKQAENGLVDLLKNDNENIEANILLADIYYKQKDFKKSLSILNNVIKIGVVKADVFKKSGDSYLGLKNYYSAIKNYKKAIKVDPFLTAAYLKIGDIYLEWQNFKEATSWYNEAVKKEQKSAEVYMHLARLNSDMEQYALANKYLKTTFEIDPNSYKARVLELKILHKTGKKRLLLDKSKVLVKKFPEEHEVRLYLGQLYSSLELWEKSKSHYDKAIKIAPQLASSYNGMGNYYYSVKDYKNAKKYYKKALELNPNYSYVYYNIGLVYWKQAKYKVAIENFSKSFKLNNGFKEALIYMSFCYLELEEKKKSLLYLKDFYLKDAKLYYDSFLRDQEYGPKIGRILQSYWDFYKYRGEGLFERGFFTALIDSKSKAMVIMRKEHDRALSYFILSRMHFLLGNTDKGKENILKYFIVGKPTKQAILLDSSFNSVKHKTWFLKAVEKLKR